MSETIKQNITFLYSIWKGGNGYSPVFHDHFVYSDLSRVSSKVNFSYCHVNKLCLSWNIGSKCMTLNEIQVLMPQPRFIFQRQCYVHLHFSSYTYLASTQLVPVSIISSLIQLLHFHLGDTTTQWQVTPVAVSHLHIISPWSRSIQCNITDRHLSQHITSTDRRLFKF